MGLFRPDEIPVALEVFDEAVHAGPRAEPYSALGADVDGRLAGWICWGPTPCTLGTYDLYWMAVDPALQGAGIGTALVLEMERRLAGPCPADRRGDRRSPGLLGHPRGSTRPGAIGRRRPFADFYAPGDDQVVFVKEVRSKK